MTTALRLIHNASEQPGKKDYINKFIQNEPRIGVLFSEFIEITLARKAKRRGKSYKKNYNTLLSHIKEFSAGNQANIYTNSVNEEFMDDFISYLEEKDLKQSYIKSIISQVKSMAKLAGTHGYAVDMSYENVDVEAEDTFSVFLSMNEITRIYYFIGLTRFQEKIRDLFVVGCLTALRYSDYSTLERDNFQGNYIVKKTKKTKVTVTIPLHDYVREIFNKYDSNLSAGKSIQHFNRYIKMICKTVGINDEINYSITRGGKVIPQTKQKWELISSHTARRSFATNMFLTRQYQTFEIMAITGHSTEKSFYRYIKISKEDRVKKIAGDNFFRK